MMYCNPLRKENHMKKRTLLITLIALLVVLGVAGVLYPKLATGMQSGQLANATAEAAQQPTEASEPAESTEPEPIPAPDFTVLDWDGNEVKLSDYIGKPVVLNFWAHWCGPCQMEMPEFNAAYERLGGEVTFLMVHEGAAVEDGKDKVTEGGYTFPVVFDVDSSAGNTYGITAYPTTFFINKEGNLQAYYMGAMDANLLQQGIDLIYTAE
jgi:thiol-disulfide isomerase/thioredoxin